MKICIYLRGHIPLRCGNTGSIGPCLLDIREIQIIINHQGCKKFELAKLLYGQVLCPLNCDICLRLWPLRCLKIYLHSMITYLLLTFPRIFPAQTIKHKWSLFSSRENVHQNFFPSGKMFIGVMTNGASLQNLSSQESYENCLYWTNYKIQPLADANYYI